MLRPYAIQEHPLNIETIIYRQKNTLAVDPGLYKNPTMPPLANLLNAKELLTMEHLFNWMPMEFEKGEITSRMYRNNSAKKIIFAYGKSYLDLGDGHEQVKWLAVADISNRWYICAGPQCHSYDYIFDFGQHIISPTTVNRLVNCDWESLQMYFI